MPGYTDVMGYLGDEGSSLENLINLLLNSGLDLPSLGAYGAGGMHELGENVLTSESFTDFLAGSDLSPGDEGYGSVINQAYNAYFEEEGLGGQIHDVYSELDEESMNFFQSLMEGQQSLLTPDEYGLEEKLQSAKGKARLGTQKARAQYIPKEIATRYGELQGRLAGGTGEAMEGGYTSDVYGLQREAGTAGRDIRQGYADEYYQSVADWLSSM